MLTSGALVTVLWGLPVVEPSDGNGNAPRGHNEFTKKKKEIKLGKSQAKSKVTEAVGLN